MHKYCILFSVLLSGLIVLATAGISLGAGLLTDPSSTFLFNGNLSGDEGGGIPETSFSSPVLLDDQPLPFSTWGSESLNSGYATSQYFIDIDSDFQPTFDSLDLKLDLGVDGEVNGEWDNWSMWGSNLDGSLVSFFELQDWTSTQVTVNMAWALTANGSQGSAGAHFNTVTIRGPLIADWANQSGFLFESTVDIPSDLGSQSSVFSQEIKNLVPGTYMVEFTSSIHSGGERQGFDSTNYGIDISNDVNIWSQNTIDPNGCLTGVPCPTLADIDGLNGVDSADFHLWYQTNVDVTGDGLINTADEAAMAYLLGLDMIDADGNGFVDGLAASPVTPGAAISAAVKLHPAYPNPFNPMTVLSFTLPSAEAVDLAVYDVKGNRIRSLLLGAAHSAGRHEMTWNGRNDAGLPTPAGVYFFRLQTKGDVQTGRMLLLK